MFEFITEMQPIDMVFVALIWILSIFVSTVLMWTLVIPKFLRNIILDMISTPTEKTVRAVQSLVIMLITTKMDTGKKVKDEDGKEHPEIIPLMNYMGREMFATFQHRMAAAKGGFKNKEAQMLEAVAQSGGDARAALPMALSAASRGDYGPLLIILSQELLNKQKTNIPNQGGGLQ